MIFTVLDQKHSESAFEAIETQNVENISMTSKFLSALDSAMEQKGSMLCVGLDPATPEMRRDACVPQEYLSHPEGEAEGLLQFCKGIIGQTSQYACAFKTNLQYILPFSLGQMQELNGEVHKAGVQNILDVKLSDIGATNRASIHWAAKAGFDAITASPFAGNVEETAKYGRELGVGIIVLTLTSNPEAHFFMRDAQIGGLRGYEWIAGKVAQSGADGCVVGATGTTREEWMEIRKTIGEERVILVPGMGAQGGDGKAAVELGGKIIVNSSRETIYSPEPGKEAKRIRDTLNGLKKK